MSCSRAYFKQSLQLNRELTISDLPFLKKEFSSAKISDDFFSHSPDFRPRAQSQVQKYNCTPKFLMTSFHSFFPRNVSFFTPVFDPYTYKVTTDSTSAQLTFYNCK